MLARKFSSSTWIIFILIGALLEPTVCQLRLLNASGQYNHPQVQIDPDDPTQVVDYTGNPADYTIWGEGRVALSLQGAANFSGDEPWWLFRNRWYVPEWNRWQQWGDYSNETSMVPFNEWILLQNLTNEYSSVIDRIQISVMPIAVPEHPYDPERDNQCIAQWQWYFQQLDEDVWYTAVRSHSSKTLFETLKTVGPGTFTTACDGISRWSFLPGNHTIETSRFTVSEWYTQTTKYFFYYGGEEPSPSTETPDQLSKRGCMIPGGDILVYNREWKADYERHRQRRSLRDDENLDCPVTQKWVKLVTLPSKSQQVPSCTFGQPETTMEASKRQSMCDGLWNSYYSSARDPFDWDARNRDIRNPRYLCPDQKDCDIQIGDSNEVVLIYWPPEKSRTRDICDFDQTGGSTISSLPPLITPRTYITNAITFQGSDLRTVPGYWIRCRELPNEGMQFISEDWSLRQRPEERYVTSSVLYGNFTFVSPTVYLAHHPISATHRSFDWLWAAATPDYHDPYTAKEQEPGGLLLKAGIITLQPNDVYSWRPRGFEGGLAYINRVAHGGGRGMQNSSSIDGETVSFNFDNLKDPVPASVYFDAQEDCWGTQSHCGTITNGHYRPKIAIKDSVWRSLLPEHWRCERPGLYDPPIMLQPIGSLASPVVQPIRTLAPWESDPQPLLAFPGAAMPAFPEQTLPAGHVNGGSRGEPNSNKNAPSFGAPHNKGGWSWGGDRGGGPRRGAEGRNGEHAPANQAYDDPNSNVKVHGDGAAGRNGLHHGGTDNGNEGPEHRENHAHGWKEMLDPKSYGNNLGGDGDGHEGQNGYGRVGPAIFTSTSSKVSPCVVAVFLIALLLI